MGSRKVTAAGTPLLLQSLTLCILDITLLHIGCLFDHTNVDWAQAGANGFECKFYDVDRHRLTRSSSHKGSSSQ